MRLSQQSAFNNSEYHLNYLFMRSTQLEYFAHCQYFERITEVYPVS